MTVASLTTSGFSLASACFTGASYQAGMGTMEIAEDRALVPDQRILPATSFVLEKDGFVLAVKLLDRGQLASRTSVDGVINLRATTKQPAVRILRRTS